MSEGNGEGEEIVGDLGFISGLQQILESQRRQDEEADNARRLGVSRSYELIEGLVAEGLDPATIAAIGSFFSARAILTGSRISGVLDALKAMNGMTETALDILLLEVLAGEYEGTIIDPKSLNKKESPTTS